MQSEIQDRGSKVLLMKDTILFFTLSKKKKSVPILN